MSILGEITERIPILDFFHLVYNLLRLKFCIDILLHVCEKPLLTLKFS